MATFPPTRITEAISSRPRIPAPMIPMVIVSFGERAERGPPAGQAARATAAPASDRSMNSRREMSFRDLIMPLRRKNGLTLIDGNVLEIGRPDVVRQRADQLVARILLEDMRGPA